MNRNHPIYICLEGLDFSGKSTVFEGVIPLLEQEGYRVYGLCPTKKSDPSYWMERMYRWLMDSKSFVAKLVRTNRFLHSACRMMLFAHRSNEAAARIATDADMLLGDRSIITSYACRWTRHNCINRMLVFLVDRMEYRIPAPDHVLFFDVPLKELHSRREQERSRALDLDENDNRANEMYRAYNELCIQSRLLKRLAHTQWHRIDASGSPETVRETVLEKIHILYKSQAI